MTVDRPPGWSVRLKLTLSYAGFVMVAGGLLLGAVWLFLLRHVPRGETVIAHGSHLFIAPGRGQLLRDFGPAVVIVLGGLLAFGLVGGWLLAGRMLAPLNRITEATRTAASGSLSHRIELPGRTDEFRELADAFDTMLAQLEAHVDEQRRFAANASHELRTPLAVTQIILEVAQNDPSFDRDELIERLYAMNTRAIDLTEALLLLSRADRKAFTVEPVELSLLAEEAVETLLPLAEKRDITVEVSTAPSPTAGSPALLLQLTTNLLHNAIVHNVPTGGSVWVTTAVQAGAATLRIENTGETIDPEVVGTLVEPFLRGTERVRRDQAGAGLGLAIAERIAAAHEGSLSLTPRAGGGLGVTVRLPLR